MKRFTIVTILLLFAISTLGYSQTRVGGNVNGVWRLADSPFLVIDDLLVRANDALQIEAGVEILFDGALTFEIQGRISAVGTAENPIQFTRSNDNVTWKQIHLNNASNNSRLEYCVIEHSQSPGQEDGEDWNVFINHGGGLFCQSCDVTIDHCLFRHNSAWGEGGAAYFYQCNPEITNSTFEFNTARHNAGAVRHRQSSGIFRNNLVSNNEAILFAGGGLFLGDHSSPLVENNEFVHNISNTTQGSGLYIEYSSNPTIIRNVITHNSQGGLFLGANCRVENFRNNTIYNNNGRAGVLLYSDCELNAVNSIFINNSPPFEIVSSVLTASFSLLNVENIDNLEIGVGCIDDDPLFVDPENGDFQLRIDSPCIEAGDPDGERDPDGSLPDIGAFFYDHGDEPPRILVEPLRLEVVNEEEQLITITNEGEGQLRVSFFSESDWLTCEPQRTLIQPDGDEDIFLIVNGDELNRGRYETTISVLSNDRDQPAILVDFVLFWGENERPVWTDLPEAIETAETDQIRFTVAGEDADHDRLTITFSSDNLPQEAGFMDHRNGSGTFTWDTDYDDAGLYSAIFVLSDGVFEIPCEIPIIVRNVNRPPRLVNPIEPQELEEDCEDRLIADLNEIFADPDDEPLTYHTISGPGIDAQVTMEGLFFARPLLNWHGETWVEIAVADSFETARDTVRIRVNPVNDPPADFELVSPAPQALVDQFPDLRFLWNTSADVVEDSAVTYLLVISFRNSSFSFSELTDTSYVVPRAFLSRAPDEATDVSWVVWADDGTDSVRCREVFNFTAAPLAVEDQKLSDLPTRTFLHPAYPNPNNAGITFSYDLATDSEIELTVFDLKGRIILTLVQGHQQAGRHSGSWNTQDLQTGTYLLRLKSPGLLMTQKVMVVK